MNADIKTFRLIKELEQPFVPNYDASNTPSPDKRSAYALENIAFRMSRLDDKLGQLVTILEALIGPQNSSMTLERHIQPVSNK